MNWPTKKLGEVCELIRGSEPGSESYFDETNKERIRFIRVGDISGKADQPKFIDKKLSNLVVVNPDEILISFDGTPGIVAKGWSGAIASGIRVIRNIKPEILKEFLFYYLQTSEPQKVIKFYTTGVTILHASRAIPHIKIPVPSLSIQQKIVERLDAIKKAQELNDKQIELAEELFQSLLHRELDPKGKNWEVKKLGEVCEKLFAGGDVPKNNFSKVKTEKYFIPIFTNGIEGKDLYGYTDIKKVIKPAVTISARGTIGYCSLRKEPFYPIIRLIVLIPNKTINLNFLYYTICNFKFFNTGTSIPQLTIPMIKNLKIPLPPLETQQKIVEKLSAVQEYKKKLLDQKQKLQELFESVLNKSFKSQL